MKPYSEYSAEELAMERLFIRWVRFPEDAPIRSFWESWLKKFPEKRETVDAAAKLVRISSDWRPQSSLSVDEVSSIWGRIRSSIGQVKEMEPLQSKLQILKIRLLYYRWYIVVSVALVILILIWLIS